MGPSKVGGGLTIIPLPTIAWPNRGFFFIGINFLKKFGTIHLLRLFIQFFSAADWIFYSKTLSEAKRKKNLNLWCSSWQWTILRGKVENIKINVFLANSPIISHAVDYTFTARVAFWHNCYFPKHGTYIMVPTLYLRIPPNIPLLMFFIVTVAPPPEILPMLHPPVHPSLPPSQ